MQLVAIFFLCNSAAEPVKFHVHGLEAFACDVVSHYSKGSVVVGMYWSGRLSMSHYFQCLACWVASRQSTNRDPSLDYATEDMTALIIWDIVMTAPLFDGMAASSDMKKCPPALLLAFVSER